MTRAHIEAIDMKKFFSAILTAIIFLTAFQIVFASGYVGNANSKIFHYAECSSVGRMRAENRVNFNSRDEAINSGYRPCKKCSP